MLSDSSNLSVRQVDVYLLVIPCPVDDVIQGTEHATSCHSVTEMTELFMCFCVILCQNGLSLMCLVFYWRNWLKFS